MNARELKLLSAELRMEKLRASKKCDKAPGVRRKLQRKIRALSKEI